MKPSFELHALAKPKLWEHLVRFAFGGAVSVSASLVASHWGPGVGGLFLAFPAILPASLTLVKQHGSRTDAADDARGARLGALALLAFAGIVFALHERAPVFVLGLATFAWLFVASALWWVIYGRPQS
jgi:hypothetical protein